MKKYEANVVNLAPLSQRSSFRVPCALSLIKAGFPSPAEDYFEPSIDLNKELISHPASTFMGRVSGESMKGAGIDEGDILIIDKSITPSNNMIAVCFLDGEFTLKFIKIMQKSVWLVPANPTFKPIEVTEQNDFLIWGIVTYIIKKAPHLSYEYGF